MGVGPGVVGKAEFSACFIIAHVCVRGTSAIFTADALFGPVATTLAVEVVTDRLSVRRLGVLSLLNDTGPLAFVAATCRRTAGEPVTR